MFKWYLIFFLIFQCVFKTGISYAQTEQADIWFERMKTAELTNLDSALIYNSKFIISAEALGDKVLIARGYNLRGLFFKNKGLYNLSEKNFLKALQYSQVSKDIAQEAMVSINFSSLKKRQLQFDEAIEYLNSAIQILHSLDEHKLLTCAYNELALVYYEIKQVDKAKDMHERALKVLGNRDKESVSKIKENLGDILELEEKYDEAIALYQACKDNYRDKEDLARINNTIGVAHWNKGSIVLAISYFKESEKEARKAKNNLLLADVLVNLGAIYQEKNQMNLADDCYKEVEAFYEQGIGGVEEQKYFAEVLADYYKANKNFKLSVTYLEEIKSLNETIRDEERENKLAQEQAKLEFALAEITIQEEKIKTQEAQLEAERQYTNFLIAMLAFLAALGVICFIFYFYKKEEKQRVLQEKEFNKKIENQLILAKLKGEKLGRKRIAGELHDDISTMLVAIKRDLELSLLKLKKGKNIVSELRKTIEITDNAYHKVRNLSHKLEPALSDWQDDMDIHIRLLEDNEAIQIEKSIDIAKPIPLHTGAEIAKIVGVLLHNIEKHAQATEVFLELTSFDQGINLIVVDNGVGFDETKIEGTGLGLKSVMRRVKDLDGHYNIDTRLGTTITIDIPLLFSNKKSKNRLPLEHVK